MQVNRGSPVDPRDVGDSGPPPMQDAGKAASGGVCEVVLCWRGRRRGGFDRPAVETCGASRAVVQIRMDKELISPKDGGELRAAHG
jgi:hypothetical protein